MKVIFCDIDGCLNRQHFGEDEQSKFGFDDHCINALRYILLHVPDAKIVIISAWKKVDIEPRISNSIPWRKVLETKLHKPGIIVADAPSLDGYYKDGKRLTRADDIRGYLSFFPSKDGVIIDNYVIIDDECSCYKGTELEDHVVDCEISTGKGLDAVNACHAVRILKGTIGPKLDELADEPTDESCKPAKDSDEFVPNICYQHLFDEAMSMAHTLQKIDQELHDAAACEGDYPGSYSSSRLLPNLCKIMYADEGYWKQDKYNTVKKDIS